MTAGVEAASLIITALGDFASVVRECVVKRLREEVLNVICVLAFSGSSCGGE